jgi:hypothetical protein
VTAGPDTLEAARYDLTGDVVRVLPRFRHDQRYLALAGGGGQYFPQVFERGWCEAPSVVVEYTGGYVLPGWDDPPTLPGEIELATLLVMQARRDRRKHKLGVQSFRLGDYGYTLAAEGASVIPGEARELLARHRRVAVG